MLDEINVMGAVDQVMKRLDAVNGYYIERIAEQIKAIGELNTTSINRINLMTDMGADINNITQRLQFAMNATIQDVMRIYQKALDDTYTDPRFRQALQHTSLTRADVARLNQYTRGISMQTARQLTNLSNTTAISETYRQAIDKAVLAVSSGMTDYQGATRQVIHDLGYNGLQVVYESGYHRRLDTAVRQNIIDGANQIAQNCSTMMGQALGFDAYEITAHAHSAPDHEPVQGRVFLIAEFEKMQAGAPFQDVDGNAYAGFRRPIGEWNCMHIAMSFSTKHSVRRYSDQQLQQWAADNQQGCDINGKHFTTYAAAQRMRQIETKIRREKDAAVAAQKAGDSTLRRQCQTRINDLMREYGEIAAASGLTPRCNRTRVEGFKAVKVN